MKLQSLGLFGCFFLKKQEGQLINWIEAEKLLVSISLRGGFFPVFQKASCFHIFNTFKAFYLGYDGEWKNLQIGSSYQQIHWSSSATNIQD